MDFSQFLVSNPDIPNIKEIKGKIPASESKPKIKPEEKKKEEKVKKENKKEPKNDKPKKSKVIDIKSVFKQTSVLEPKEDLQIQLQQNFKRGDFVKIIRLEGSNLNVYKGYFGEIKEYIQRSDSAYIILEAMSYPRPIKFPLGHFVHRTKF